jgi:undecaprenyl diphosphate synthase
MDGNGRWAKRRHLPRAMGHQRGVEAVRRLVRGLAPLGIECLTIYAFSSENWKRPPSEVSDLMGLLRLYLRHEIAELSRNGARLRVIGARTALARDIVELIEHAERLTAANTKIDLNIALNYGSRDEIVRAARALAEAVARGELKPEQIDEATFAHRLMTDGIPDPDLLIRTSGEQRISNFLLWQSAYAEFMFTDVLWPDFGKAHLEAAIAEYAKRERRYGAVAGV